jgi:uncharacterized protein (TIGR03000 family)
MNASKMGLTFSGILTACLWTATWTSVNAQSCGCGGGDGVGASQDIVYEAAMSPDKEAEMLLADIDDPATIINLTVVVQDKAIVKINGEETYTKGTVRPYIVRGLTAGKEYNFVVEGLVKMENGAEYTAQKEVKIKAGSQDRVVLKLRRSVRKPVVPPVVDPTKAAAAAAIADPK